MTREEETKEAYKDYMNNGGMFQSNPWFYFKAGTEWADKHPVNVWHDPSEEHKDDSALILYQYKSYSFWFAKKKHKIRYYGNWKNFVIDEQVIRWIYVKDIFPKGGEK